MSDVSVFLVGLGTTVVVSFVVVAYLAPPLRKILLDLCGTLDRANFWLAFSNVAIVLVPAIFALDYQPRSGPETNSVFEMGNQLKKSLSGLVGTVVTLGIVLGSFIPRAAPPRSETRPAAASHS